MSAQNTPGPWMADPPNGKVPGMIRHKSEICGDWIPVMTKLPGNVALIASAPELLSALERLLNTFRCDAERVPEMDIKTCWETNGNAIQQARTAIAKAKGTP